MRDISEMNLMGKNNDRTINEIIRLMQTDDSVDAPIDAIRWSENIFRARAVTPKPGFLERISAVLQMELLPNRAAFGERSASASQARQMLFQAGDNALDMRIVKTGQNFDLTGQILGEGFAKCSIKIGGFEVTASETSEFRFVQIPCGVYDLILRSGKQEIVVNLELK